MSHWSVVVAAVLAAGCVTHPYVDDFVLDKHDPILVDGYAESGNTWISVKALNFFNGQYEEVGGVWTAATPTYAAGAWSHDSPALYYYSTYVQFQDYGDCTTCDPYWNPVFGAEAAVLQVWNTQTGLRLSVGTEYSLACFLTEISPTASFLATAFDCGYVHAEAQLIAW